MNIFLLLSHTTFLSIKKQPLEHHTQGGLITYILPFLFTSIGVLFGNAML